MFDLKYASELLRNLGALLEKATLEEKKQIFHALLNRVWVEDGVIKTIEPMPVLWVLLLILSVGRTGSVPVIEGREPRGLLIELKSVTRVANANRRIGLPAPGPDQRQIGSLPGQQIKGQ
jgi:hypothetical protein